MKKHFIVSTLILACLTLTACQSSKQSQKSNSESKEESSLVKANSKLKKSISKDHKDKDEEKGSQVDSVNSSTKSSANSKKSQGQINRERGYDPNGNPLLPGQDHAAGSNPDGSPDAWVQTQINEEQFDQQNGLIGPDGRFNDKGKAYYNLPDDFYSGN